MDRRERQDTPKPSVTRVDDRCGETFVMDRLETGHLVGSFPALSALTGIVHRVTSRDGPDFAGPADTPQLADSIDQLAAELRLDGAAWADQVHGGAVREAAEPGLAGPADGLWSTRPGLGTLGRSADCPLVLLAAPVVRGEPRRRWAVGMAHASWRATAAGITERVAQALIAVSGAEPADLVAAICPSAGPCCYEVGEEVRAVYHTSIGPHAEAYFSRRQERLRLDLWAANSDQLCRSGLSPTSIHTAGICTICRNDLFASYRAEGRGAGRFAAIVGTIR